MTSVGPDVALIAALRSALAAAANPAQAEPMRAYMKSAMPYLGVKTPALRKVCRAVFAAHPLVGYAQWEATVRALWREATYHEERYAAMELAGDRRYHEFHTLDALPLYEEMIVSGAWWDYVDPLATYLIGDLLRRYPEAMRETVLAWSRDPDYWRRRAAIICQLGFKAEIDESLLFACIEPNLSDHYFFIRKGIGWALREYAKTAPDAVRAFVKAHESTISPLSRREALKHLGGVF
ncbi:MAG TPA: DNA alkylation repair protein [Ktedonobacterales bacterium]